MIHAKLCRLIRSPALILLLPVGLTVLLSILLLSPLEIGNGFDGYYYALQTRSVRETGTLLIPDQPLVFYLAAALSFLTGNPVTGVAALKIIIQASVTGALFVLVRDLTKQTGPALWAALLWAVSFSGLYFSFELLKNNAGNLIVLLFFIFSRTGRSLPVTLLTSLLFLLTALATHAVSAGIVLLASLFFIGKRLFSIPFVRTHRLLVCTAAAGLALVCLGGLFLFRFRNLAMLADELSFSPFERYAFILSSFHPPVIRWEIFTLALVLPLAGAGWLLFRRRLNCSPTLSAAGLVLLILSFPLWRLSWDGLGYRFLLQAPLFALIGAAALFTSRPVVKKPRSPGMYAAEGFPYLVILVLLLFLPEKMTRLRLNYQPDYATLLPVSEQLISVAPQADLVVAHKGLSSLLWYQTRIPAIHFSPPDGIDHCVRVTYGFGPIHFDPYLRPDEQPPRPLSPLYTLVPESLWRRFYHDRRVDIPFLDSWLNPNQPAPAHIRGPESIPPD